MVGAEFLAKKVSLPTIISFINLFPLVNMRGGQACDFMDEELIAKACATVDQKRL